MSENEIPRRSRLDLNEPVELAIYEAMQAVEKMPPDVGLTNAVIKLQEARNLVADFIDKKLNQKPIDKNNWTQDEVDNLKKYGYWASTGLSFSTKENCCQLRKEFNGYDTYYRIGVEGIGYDVDGDSGWTRTWYSFKTMEELINSKYFQKTP